MNKTVLLICISILAGNMAFAQNATTETTEAPQGETPNQESNSSGPTTPETTSVPAPVIGFKTGEQSLGIALGISIPNFLLPVTGGGSANLGLGAALNIFYHYYVFNGLAIGGSLSGTYNSTIGGQSLFIIPLGATLSYWWSVPPFELSVLSEFGAYLMRYSAAGNISPFVKLGAGFFWRINTSWSIGLRGIFWYVPEVHTGSFTQLVQHGGFTEVSISAIYHL